MGISKKTNDWSPNHLAQFEYYLSGDCKVKYSQSSNFSYTTTKENISQYDLVISYNCGKRLFVAWNAKIHHYVHKGEKIKLSASIGHDAYDTDKKLIIPKFIWKNATNNTENGYEKVVFFSAKAIADFCLNWEELLTPNCTDSFQYQAYYIDVDGKINYIKADSNTFPIIRAKDQVLRTRRSRDFRKRILEKYNSTCLICGCREEKLLQAAHIDSVADGGSDASDNGICLCANHHLLYDCNLLNISPENGTFECLSDPEKTMPWYKEAEKNGFQLKYPLF